MSDVREEVESVLADDPSAESRLRELVAVDAEHEAWSFRDTSLDSGEFGELVDSPLVETVGDGYRLVDRAAVESALDGETDPSRDGTQFELDLSFSPSREWASVATAVVAAHLFVLLARVVPTYAAVFRDDHVVLAGNDPYFFRYWGEELLRSELTAFSLDSLGSLPPLVVGHDVLAILLAWWGGAALGGTPAAVGTVLAWYPPVAGVVTAALLYAVTVRASGDRRVALCAVALLAVTPSHAFRTAVGFGDHHALDYVLLATTVWAVVVSVGRREIGRRRRAAAAVVLGVSVAATTVAWRGGPLHLVPVGLFALLSAYATHRAGTSPSRRLWPLALGVAVGALLTALSQWAFGWLTLVRTVVPTLLLAGVVVVVAVGEATRRLGTPPWTTPVGGGVGVTALGVAAAVAVPAVPTTAGAFADYLAETGQSGIAETASLLGGEVGLFLGPLLLTGATLYLGVPFLFRGLAAGLRADHSEWLVVAVYAAWFLLLSVVQLRFAGQLGLLVAPFAGVGFVWLASVVDVADRPTVFGATGDSASYVPSAPSRQTLVSVGVLFLVLGGVGAVQTTVKSEQVATDDATYQVATELPAVAGETSGDEYVLSRWGENRVYNYFLTGDSRSYSFARREFGAFAAATNRTAAWRQAGSRAEFVVVGAAETAPETVHSRLYEEYGSGTAETRGLEHYRFVAADDEGRRRAFETVPGASVPVLGRPNTSVTVTVPVRVDGTEFTYSRRVTTDRYGEATVTVPYPGEYRTSGGRTAVSEDAVDRGALVGAYRLHLPLDEGSGRTVTATVGDGRGELDGERWTTGVVGSGLAFDGDGDGSLRLRGTDVQFGERSGTVCAWVAQSDSDRRLQDVVNVGRWGLVLTWNGRNDAWLARVAGEDTAGRAKTIVDGHEGWSHLCVRVDRGTVELWIDGQRRASGRLTGAVTASGDPFFVGGYGQQRQFDGRIDDVRVYSRGLSPAEIKRLAAAGGNRTTQSGS